MIHIISQEQRMKVADELSKGTESSLTFFIMVALSTIIATYGLIKNSILIVMGAMLVAPLMTPILAFSLSLIRGDIHLMRKSLEAELKGVFVTLVVALLVALISPGMGATPEILARTQPNFFDLVIAIAAGAATAYAITQEGMSVMFPGVVIAILLVPPLSVAGIGLSLRDFNIVGGSLLLFVTNLVAIIFSSSCVFWLRGFVPYWASDMHAEVRRKLIATFTILFIVAIPLVLVMYSAIHRTSISNSINDVLIEQVVTGKNAQLIEYSFKEAGKKITVTTTIRSPQRLSARDTRRIKKMIEEKINQPVSLKVFLVPFDVIESK
ncbi:TIGR00341 family protein [Candidatus Margulisiibacteriota bacterium]